MSIEYEIDDNRESKSNWTQLSKGKIYRSTVGKHPFSLIESNVDDNQRHKLSESKIPIPYLINLNSKLDIDRTIQLVFVLMLEQHWIVQHILPLSA